MKTPEIAAIVAVDVSPLWMHGHTLAAQEDPEIEQVIDAQMQMALASERIHEVLNWAYESGKMPWFVVESMHLGRFNLDDFKGQGALALCGVYGDACVLEAARYYQKLGFSVFILQDACLWEFTPAQHTNGEFDGIQLIKTTFALPYVEIDDFYWEQDELLCTNRKTEE